MSKICLYFHLHQPYRLGEMNVFDLGTNVTYFKNSDRDVNREVFKKVAQKSYLPMLSLLLKLARHHADFRVSLSLPGVFIEQALAYESKVLDLIKKLVATGKCDILAETYYHSLAFLYSKEEFIFQIKKQIKTIQKYFGLTPTVFRNTELIYANYIATMIKSLKFRGILTEAVDYYLQGAKKTQLFLSYGPEKTPLLLKHAQLSDDVAFRFSNRFWESYPLTAEKYLDWVQIYPENEYINLFMDFETFGEHQWADTGIFNFFEHFVEQFLAKPWNQFCLPKDVCQEVWDKKKTLAKGQKIQDFYPIYDVPNLISWADVDRSITAWRDNAFQYDSLRLIYDLRSDILKTRNRQLIDIWRKLQASDHFYYMCTKWSADGDVHAYFSPYRDPYEAYRLYSIVLADLKHRLYYS